MSDKKKDPLKEIIRPEDSSEDHSNADQVEKEAESEQPDVSVHLIRDVTLLFRLCVRPTKALTLLFAPAWPRYLATLYFLYLFIPLLANSLVDYSIDYKELFFFVNRSLTLSPETFQNLFFYISSFSLFALILIGGFIQKIVFHLQRVPLSFTDSLASICYALFPVLIPQTLLYLLGILTNETAIGALGLTSDMSIVKALLTFEAPLTALLEVLFFVANIWSLYVWYIALQILTGFSLRQILASGTLMVAIPLLLLFLTALTIFISRYDFSGTEKPQLDHIRDSFHERQPEPDFVPGTRW